MGWYREVALLLAEREQDSDCQAIASLEKQDVAGVNQWLRKYGVFQGIKGNDRQSVTEVCLSFRPDYSLRMGKVIDPSRAKSMIESLERHINQNLNMSRKWTSLSSKFLWLHFPENMPIYDSYARSALSLLCRMSENVQPKEERCYFEEWYRFFEIWNKVENDAPPTTLKYPMRIYDQFLWGLGKPLIVSL